jgi:glycosyltransferase involved in cell wall biosynthesis
MRLLITSHVVHYGYEGAYYAYSPYAKEIEVWADLFPEIVIAAPYRDEVPPSDNCRIGRPNVRVAPLKEVGGETWAAKCGIAAALPSLVFSLCREMRKADAIHVRCPGNIGLLGALLAPLFSRRLIAKYAGQWNGFPGEEWTVRLQRFLLRSAWWKGPVTVYGKRPGEREHVVDFFSSMFTDEQLERARACAFSRHIQPVKTIAFVGRLSKAKNVDILLHSVAALNREGLRLRAVIVGDGPERDALQALADELGIALQVEFAGAVPPERVPEVLERSDIFVLVSQSEGWPKSIAEAMAFGLVCVGSDLGLIRTFLGDGRGILVPSRDIDALTGALRKIAATPAEYREMRMKASVWAQRYSIEGLRKALQQVMSSAWQRSGTHLVAGEGAFDE